MLHHITNFPGPPPQAKSVHVLKKENDTAISVAFYRLQGCSAPARQCNRASMIQVWRVGLTAVCVNYRCFLSTVLGWVSTCTIHHNALFKCPPCRFQHASDCFIFVMNCPQNTSDSKCKHVRSCKKWKAHPITPWSSCQRMPPQLHTVYSSEQCSVTSLAPI